LQFKPKKKIESKGNEKEMCYEKKAKALAVIAIGNNQFFCILSLISINGYLGGNCSKSVGNFVAKQG